MGVSSILQRLEKRGKPINLSIPQQNEQSASSTRTTNLSKNNTSSFNKPIDPVVARLKEKRRLEREQLEGAKSKSNGAAKSKSTNSNNLARSSSATTSKPKSQPKPTYHERPQPPPVKPKLNFNALMKKANEIDHDKLSIKYPQKSKSPESEKPKKPFSAVPEKKSILTNNKSTPLAKSKPLLNRQSKAFSKPTPPIKKVVSKVPIPSRQPNAKVQEKIQQHKKTKQTQMPYKNGHRIEEEEEDSDLDDFLVSDEEIIEEDDEEGYDREQIWAMFNKGKKRGYATYDDYSDDDMEATGADILEEEFRSKMDAEREDRREAENEKRRALEKQKRKKIR
ncbi:hypothetical protein KGF54_003673 [Candida jiufengensis]|uniref:uncharacterized protein n=1 Tax=Candida jiufengensis TaxID=497108 RepID=UPI002224BE71|nr:uncharacterized protein KGF54_003673 [Candida jiufengensis]KAI5952806.1 hypothetical protein KGF54_003673 [Candida jiufengensis]